MKRVLYLVFVLWTINANAQTGNTDYYEVDESLPEIIIENNGGSCERLRDDVGEMSLTEQEDLLDCIMAYLNSENNPDFDEDNDPLWESNFVVWEHFDNGDAWHNGEEIGFFTGHRGYLEKLEDYLLTAPGCESFVPLPAFNPAESAGGIPGMFFDANSVLDDFQGGLNGDLEQPLDNQFPNLTQLPISHQTCDQFEGDINDFATFIEKAGNQYNAVHAAIGGVMAEPEISPSSAIFWLWHAYVDDTYRCYQQLCQCGDVNVNYNGCELCLDINSDVTGNNTALNFNNIDSNGDIMPLDISLNDEGCLDLGASEELQIQALWTNIEGDICEPQNLTVGINEELMKSCYCDTPVATYQDGCKICFETGRQRDSFDESVWTFTDVDGEVIEIGLDDEGCIFGGWPNNLQPGGFYTISIGGEICEDETKTFQMPINHTGDDSKFGKSCIQIEINPTNPFSDQLIIDIENLGEEEDLSIFRMDVFTGQRERILSPVRLNNGEQYQVVYDASHWQNGTHLIHVYYGEYLIADQVIKQE